MRRDISLIRRLVLALENDEATPDTFEAYSEEQVVYHRYLTVDGGLAKSGVGCSFHLTDRGHDFADAVRSDRVWEGVLEKLAAVGLSGAETDILIALAHKTAAEQHGIGSDWHGQGSR